MYFYVLALDFLAWLTASGLENNRVRWKLEKFIYFEYKLTFG